MLKLTNFEEIKIDNLTTYCCGIENDDDEALETLQNRLAICDINYDNLSKDDLAHFKVALSNDSEKWFIMLMCGEDGFAIITNDFKFKRKSYEVDMQKAFDEWVDFPKKVRAELGENITIKEYDDEFLIQIKK